MAAAVDDGLIRRNPCRIKAAGIEKSPERPVLTLTEVYALAEAVGPRYRALVLLACFCGLRWASWPRCAAATSIPTRVPCGWPASLPRRQVTRCTSVRPSPTRAAASSLSHP
jgi:hypothetical protein